MGRPQLPPQAQQTPSHLPGQLLCPCLSAWCCAVLTHSVMSDSATPWTVARQVPLSWDSPGQNPGVGSLSLLQGIFPNPGIKPRSPALQVNSLPMNHQESPGSALTPSKRPLFPPCGVIHQQLPALPPEQQPVGRNAASFSVGAQGMLYSRTAEVPSSELYGGLDTRDAFTRPWRPAVPPQCLWGKGAAVWANALATTP